MKGILGTTTAVANAIAGKSGIKVVVSGSEAKTNGDTIFIPDLGEMTEEKAMMIRGYIDHEAGHCRHSDMSLLKEIRSEELFSLFNILEDIREEKVVGQEYPGSLKNFANLNNYLLRKTRKESRSKLFSLFVEGYRQVAGQEIEVEDMTEDVEKNFGKGIIDKMKAMNSTKDALNLAKELLGEEKPEKKEEKGEDKAKGEGKPEKQEEKSEEKAKVEEKDKGENKGEEKSEEKPEEKESEEQGEGEEKQEGEGDGVGAEEVEGEKSESEGEGEGEGEGEEKNEEGEKASGGSPSDSHDEGLSPDVLKELKDVKGKGKIIEDEISQIAGKELRDGKYMVVSTDEDKIIKVKEAGSTDYYNAMRSSLGSLNSLRAKFSSIFLANTSSRWIGDRESGKINNRALSSVVTGGRRVFKQKYNSRKIDTAVTFLVDFSGSMGCTDSTGKSRLERAMESVVLFLETLNSVGVKSEVLGYTTAGYSKAAHDEKRLFRYYGRVEKLVTYEFKRFDEPFNSSVKRKISNYHSLRVSENCDPCSLRVAHERLIARKEERKILIVLSDGEVANLGDTRKGAEELERLVRGIEKSGKVEIIGIGLESPHVKAIYSNSILVRRGDNLSSVIFNGVKTLLSK